MSPIHLPKPFRRSSEGRPPGLRSRLLQPRRGAGRTRKHADYLKHSATNNIGQATYLTACLSVCLSVHLQGCKLYTLQFKVYGVASAIEGLTKKFGRSWCFAASRLGGLQKEGLQPSASQDLAAGRWIPTCPVLHGTPATSSVSARSLIDSVNKKGSSRNQRVFFEMSW